MGCDIHLDVERRLEDGTWELVPKTKKRDYGTGFWYEDHWDGRNYDLFAILADVRNGRGFAGFKTGDGFNPICPPKGTPEDVSPEHKLRADEMGIDGHSHSWQTLRELLDYDWDQTTKHTHWIQDKLEPGTPLYEKAVEMRAPTEDRAAKAAEWFKVYGDYPRWAPTTVPISPPANEHWTEWQSESPYSQAAGVQFMELMLRMWRWANGDPDAVRIVYFFDN